MQRWETANVVDARFKEDHKMEEEEEDKKLTAPKVKNREDHCSMRCLTFSPEFGREWSITTLGWYYPSSSTEKNYKFITLGFHSNGQRRIVYRELPDSGFLGWKPKETFFKQVTRWVLQLLHGGLSSWSTAAKVLNEEFVN